MMILFKFEIVILILETRLNLTKKNTALGIPLRSVDLHFSQNLRQLSQFKQKQQPNLKLSNNQGIKNVFEIYNYHFSQKIVTRGLMAYATCRMKLFLPKPLFNLLCMSPFPRQSIAKIISKLKNLSHKNLVVWFVVGAAFLWRTINMGDFRISHTMTASIFRRAWGKAICSIGWVKCENNRERREFAFCSCVRVFSTHQRKWWLSTPILMRCAARRV